jgi:hypothetical protein
MTDTTQSNVARLREHGFWDYTTPGAGGMEKFQQADYASLLDDMAEAGMNSLLVLVKWFTTGYRSSLPFLDQVEGNPVIDSDNELLRWAIAQAAARGIKVWLSAVVSYYACRPYGGTPESVMTSLGTYQLPEKVGLYDADTPMFQDRAVAIFEELVELFPGIAGLMIELEFSGNETPHRIPLYNAWAAQNGAPPFEKLGHPLNARNYDTPPWRDYTTHRRLEICQTIERAARAKGFRGEMAMICETGCSDYNVTQEVNLKMFHQRMPDWTALTYEYDKHLRRYGMMEMCLATPKAMGLRTYYLPRGVMTWGGSWPLPISLQESWKMDVEDIHLFGPDGVWWFGCGTVSAGFHVDLAKLRQSGFADGTAARRALLDAAKTLRPQENR